jgi:hypothetical protein
MEIERRRTLPGPPERAFALVDDLAAYPGWMDLVHQVSVAVPEARRSGESPADSPAEPPAWNVELQAQVGPFARSKRLRMVRTVHRPPSEVVFERAEVDGRRHSPWVLRATLSPAVDEMAGDTVELVMTLTYGGNLWTGAVLQRVLDDHVERGAQALAALLGADETSR